MAGPSTRCGRSLPAFARRRATRGHPFRRDSFGDAPSRRNRHADPQLGGRLVDDRPQAHPSNAPTTSTTSTTSTPSTPSTGAGSRSEICSTPAGSWSAASTFPGRIPASSPIIPIATAPPSAASRAVRSSVRRDTRCELASCGAVVVRSVYRPPNTTRDRDQQGDVSIIGLHRGQTVRPPIAHPA